MKVLLTTDGSPEARDAIREAARLLPLGAAEVHVVAVADVIPFASGFDPAHAAAMGTAVGHELAATRADAEEAVALLASLGVTAVPHERRGDAGAEIMALGAALRPDVIVIGAHGKHAWERWLLGSTSDALVHRWHGAVLVIKPPVPA